MRACVAVLVVSIAVALSACGSSSTTSATSPSTTGRCGVTVNANSANVSASGGSGTLAVTTARECSWTANSSASWLSVRGNASGQGDGSVDYVVAANSDPGTRQGMIQVNDQQFQVSQSGADCTITLQQTSANFPTTGGSGSIAVAASSGQCTWTAVADSSWITIRSGASGTGSGTVTFDVAAATTQSRAGGISVAGVRFDVLQTQGCTYTVSPNNYSAPSAGGTTTIAVTTTDGCPWTASSNVSWAAIAQGSSGSGSGTVQIAVGALSGPSRSGTVQVAGQVVTLSQSSGCSLAVDPLAGNFGASGGSATVTVQGGPGCDWSASTDVPWITFTGSSAGSGNGSFGYSVAASSGPARSGTISVAGAQIAISQAGGCAVSFSPQSQQVGAGGGDVTISVSAAAGCSWNTTSSVAWITVVSGANGSGDGSVRLTVSASNSGARSGTVFIGGNAFTVTQGNGCAFSISPQSANAPGGLSTGSVSVSSGQGCQWTASSNVSWLTISSGPGGSGNGTVQYAVAANSSTARSGTLTIAGQTFTVNQASGCTFNLSGATANVPASASTGSVGVTAGAGCGWNASSTGNSWLKITGGNSGSGNGAVQYSVAANSGPARTDTLSIAGQTFTVNQANGCTFDVTPLSYTARAIGESFNVSVKASDQSCQWTIVDTLDWASASISGPRTGNVNFELRVNPNPLTPRQGTVTVAGATITISQPPIVP